MIKDGDVDWIAAISKTSIYIYICIYSYKNCNTLELRKLIYIFIFAIFYLLRDDFNQIKSTNIL